MQQCSISLLHFLSIDFLECKLLATIAIVCDCRQLFRLCKRVALSREKQLVLAGFTSKQAYKMGIPAIGIVAVLVANVAFIAWSTPPGNNSIIPFRH